MFIILEGGIMFIILEGEIMFIILEGEIMFINSGKPYREILKTGKRLVE